MYNQLLSRYNDMNGIRVLVRDILHIARQFIRDEGVTKVAICACVFPFSLCMSFDLMYYLS